MNNVPVHTHAFTIIYSIFKGKSFIMIRISADSLAVYIEFLGVQHKLSFFFYTKANKKEECVWLFFVCVKQVFVYFFFKFLNIFTFVNKLSTFLSCWISNKEIEEVSSVVEIKKNTFVHFVFVFIYFFLLLCFYFLSL